MNPQEAVTALRKLIADWRNASYSNIGAIADEYRRGLGAGLAVAATELENTLNLHTNLQELFKEQVKTTLASVKGDKTAAAQILGVNRRTLYRWLERWENNGSSEDEEREEREEPQEEAGAA